MSAASYTAKRTILISLKFYGHSRLYWCKYHVFIRCQNMFNGDMNVKHAYYDQLFQTFFSLCVYFWRGLREEMLLLCTFGME